MDKMRALITGPEGTPYYAGCFIFDIYFPGGCTDGHGGFHAGDRIGAGAASVCITHAAPLIT